MGWGDSAVASRRGGGPALTEHLDTLIESSISSGRDQNASEVVRDGLRLLEQRQPEDEAKLERPKAEVPCVAGCVASRAHDEDVKTPALTLRPAECSVAVPAHSRTAS